MNLSTPGFEGRRLPFARARAGELKVHPEPCFPTPPLRAGHRAVERVKFGGNVFVDTSAFIALRVADDVKYTKAQHFLTVIKETRLRLHTTNFILDEVYTYFCRFHEVAMEMAELIIENPLITLYRVSPEDEKTGLEILKTFNDKDFSYTDATSFAVMQRLNIHTAFAFDEHFTQYGKFVIVP